VDWKKEKKFPENKNISIFSTILLKTLFFGELYKPNHFNN